MLLAASVLLSCAQLEESRCERLAAVVSHAQSQSALLPRSALPFSLVSHPAEARSLLSAHDAFVFDCDGVLWSGSLGLLPGVADLLEHLERLGKRSIFVTNNSAKSRAQYAEKFRALGLRVDPEQIVPASYAAARWLRSARPSLQAAFVIGEQGVDDELRAVGKSRTSLTQVSHKSHKRLTHVSHKSHTPHLYATAPLFFPCQSHSSSLFSCFFFFAGIEPIHLPRSRPPFDESAFANARADPRVGAVVVGADHSFEFGALAIASLYLESPEVLFVATNTDAFDIVGKRRLPGNGCLVAAVQMATSRKPDAVTG